MSRYTKEPKDRAQYTERFDRFYTRFARVYDYLVRVIPLWRKLLDHALPFLHGRRVLEVSFGTGYLLTRYADRFQTYGIDYNRRMVSMAKDKLKRLEIAASLQVASVDALPYADASFDTILCTMAFSGYPDGKLALSEMNRVLSSDGRLVLIDADYPHDDNFLGTLLTKAWAYGGDIIRDMGTLFEQFGFHFTDDEIGGFGSVHLYVAKKPLQ
jgi:ubiquinone/menaquinone biosynthesis C-methylase UbiE